MKNIAVLTSGGDAPGMNAAIRGVVRTCVYNDIRVMGVRNGYQGLIEGNIFDMNISTVADIIHRGGTILGTARSKDFQTEKGLKKAVDVLKIFNIDGLVCLGGDGTYRGAKTLEECGIPVIGIPCTIDNDMGYTDYTIGFFTAVETITEAIGKLRDTSSSHSRANIVEVMGRFCGDLALYAGLAGGAESIIVPEIEFDVDAVCEKALRGRMRGKKHNIIVISENITNPYDLAKAIKEKTDIDTRVTVLGHVQRGGSPTSFDRIIASEMGRRAVELLIEGKSGIALGIKNNMITETDLKKAVEMKRELNRDLYDTAKILSI